MYIMLCKYPIRDMKVFVLLMLFANQGISMRNGANIELKANVGKCLIIGDTLKLTCSITNWNDINKPDLQLLQIQHSSMGIVNTSIVNDRTIQAIILYTEEDDVRMYECRYLPDRRMAMALVFKVTDHDPMPEEIKCIVNGEKTRQVDCTWTSKDLCATWRLFYSKSGDHEAECVRPKQNVHDLCAGHSIGSNRRIETRCREPPPNGEPLQMKCSMDILFKTNYTLRLERKNSFGHDKQTVTKMFDNTFIKLYPPQHLHVHQTSTSLSLDWRFRNPPTYYDNGIVCKVKCGTETKTLKFPDNETREVRGILFKDLHPFTEYNITLICKVSGSRYWGDPLYRTYQTEEDIPLDGPHTTDHSYTLAGCILEKSGTCLTIHTQVDTVNARGNIKGYAVEIRRSRIPELKQRFDFSNSSTSLEIGPLANGMIPPFNVSIWSKTSKGSSNRSTHIVINPNKDAIDIREVVVEEEEDYFLITTKLFPGYGSSEFIFHWCFGVKTHKTVTCKGGYGYRKSPELEIPIEKTELYGSYVTAEATNIYRWYFGMSISTGAATTVRSPLQPERPVLSEGIRNQIVVHVQSFCPPVNSKSESYRPMNYTVVASNIDDRHDERTKTFEARYNHDRLEINDLKPGSIYSVKYNIGYRQRLSPYSELASKYISAQPQIEIFVGLAVGITFVLLIGILIVWKLAKWYNKIEQPIEGVEIDNNNWGKFNTDTKESSEGMCVEPNKDGDIIEYVVESGSHKGHEPFHYSSKVFGNKTDSKNDTLARRHGSDIFDSSYKIIGSISTGTELDVKSAGSRRSESSENNEERSTTPKDSLCIESEQIIDVRAICLRSTMTPDIVCNTREAKNEQSSVDETCIGNQSVTTGNTYSKENINVDNTHESYMPMNGFSDVTLDEQDMTAVLFSVTEKEETYCKDDYCQKDIEDFTVQHPSHLPYKDEQSLSQRNEIVGRTEVCDKTRRALLGYKQLPHTQVLAV